MVMSWRQLIIKGEGGGDDERNKLRRVNKEGRDEGCGGEEVTQDGHGEGGLSSKGSQEG